MNSFCFMHVQIEESWRLRLQEEFDKPYFERLVRFVKEKYARYSVFPPGSRIFMLIIPVRLRSESGDSGEDLYQEPGQYYGLYFSGDGRSAFPVFTGEYIQVDTG